MVLSHIDQFSCYLDALECSLEHSFRASYECNHCTVSCFTRIYVQNFHSTGFLD